MLEELRKAGFELINDEIKLMWISAEENTKQCMEFGENVVK